LLGNAKPDAWRDLLFDNSRVNATKFNIAVNCLQKLTTKFTPTVTMKFEKPFGTTCVANNELTSADATNATIEIIRTVEGVTTTVCPATSNTPTTLAFTAHDPTSTQLYSDSITLQAAFRGAFGATKPKTGPFSTRVTFTVAYQ
jgi:type 1 fimbria pilin